MPDTLLGAGGAVRITPPPGTSLAGYFTDRRAEGVHDDLYASVLALGYGGSGLVLVACDLCAVPAELALRVRAAVSSRSGVPPESVLVSATHTHTGPVTGGDLADPAYLRELVEKIADTAARVWERREPCTVSHGSGTDSRFAFNRRYLMRDGTVVTNPGPRNPAVIRPAGPVDHSLHVLRVADAGDRTLALLACCACHPDTTDGNLVSADWPGALRDTVQAAVGRGVPVLVLNGPAGDVNHFDVLGGRVVQSTEEARKIGSGYGATALAVLGRAKPLGSGPLGVWTESVVVPGRRIAEHELSAARGTVEELEGDPEARLEGHLESQDIARGSKAVRLMFARELLGAAAPGRSRDRTLEMSLVRIGGLGILTVNGEPFTEIGLAVKRASPFAHTFVAELVNGSIGYLGTRLSYRQGGYETLRGDRVCDEVEEYVLAAAGRLIARAAESVDGRGTM